MSLVCRSVTVGVFDDNDPVAFFPLRNVAVSNLLPVVDDFANPDSAQVVNVDVGRVG